MSIPSVNSYSSGYSLYQTNSLSQSGQTDKIGNKHGHRHDDSSAAADSVQLNHPDSQAPIGYDDRRRRPEDGPIAQIIGAVAQSLQSQFSCDEDGETNTDATSSSSTASSTSPASSSSDSVSKIIQDVKTILQQKSSPFDPDSQEQNSQTNAASDPFQQLLQDVQAALKERNAADSSSQTDPLASLIQDIKTALQQSTEQATASSATANS